MLVLAIPVLSLRLSASDASNDPSASTIKQACGPAPSGDGQLKLAGSLKETVAVTESENQ
jgi:hypothetical protein